MYKRERQEREREWVRRERERVRREMEEQEREKSKGMFRREGEKHQGREKGGRRGGTFRTERESERNRGNLSGREARESDNYKKE